MDENVIMDKFCKKCGILLVPSENITPSMYYASHFLCRSCNNERVRLMRKNNPEYRDRVNKSQLERYHNMPIEDRKKFNKERNLKYGRNRKKQTTDLDKVMNNYMDYLNEEVK